MTHTGNCIRKTLNFEMWCWRRMEKLSWTDHVRNKVLHTVNVALHGGENDTHWKLHQKNFEFLNMVLEDYGDNADDDFQWVGGLTVPMRLVLTDRPFVPHNISAQHSPVPYHSSLQTCSLCPTI
jgi:hypothetical protein